MKIKKSTIVRTILLFVAILNRFLTTRGITTITADEQLAGLIADVFIAVAAVVAWWYNNSFTKNYIAADNYAADLCAKPEDNDEEDEVQNNKKDAV